MRCPKCDFVQSDQNTECLKCGIIFEKYYEHPTPILRKRTVTPKEKEIAIEVTLFSKSLSFLSSRKGIPFTWAGGLSFF